MRTPHGARHTGPGLLESQDTLDIVAKNLFSGDRVDDRGLNTEERKGRTARLGGGNTAKGSDDVGASLGLPICLQRNQLVSEDMRIMGC